MEHTIEYVIYSFINTVEHMDKLRIAQLVI